MSDLKREMKARNIAPAHEARIEAAVSAGFGPGLVLQLLEEFGPMALQILEKILAGGGAPAPPA